MTALWFVVPAHGRHEIAQLCFRELSGVCKTLREHNIEATAVVIADEPVLLDRAIDLGFFAVYRTNDALGRKFNDGYELATSPAFEKQRAGFARADYVVPIGSDDWIDPRWIFEKPLDPTVMRCARWWAAVREDGHMLAYMNTVYRGGVGIRIIPSGFLERFGWRPAIEDRSRGIDGTMLARLRHQLRHELQIDYFDLHPAQIVDWKTLGPQLTSFDRCRIHQIGEDETEPFRALAASYSAEALEAMQEIYASTVAGAA